MTGNRGTVSYLGSHGSVRWTRSEIAHSFTYLFLCLKDGGFFPSHKRVVQVEMVVLIPTF